MTGADAIEMFKRIIDDTSIDSEVALDFLNSAQDELALERAWGWLTAIDTTIDWSAADTYLTQHSAPTDFLYPTLVYVSGFTDPFEEIPFEHRERYKDISYKVSWDHRQKKLHFMGRTDQARDVSLSYIVKPTEIADDTTEIANWPSTVHRMLVYYATGMWLGGTDADSITKVMQPEHAAAFQRLHKRAVSLDAKLRSRAKNYRAISPSRDVANQSNIVTDL